MTYQTNFATLAQAVLSCDAVTGEVREWWETQLSRYLAGELLDQFTGGRP